MGRFVRAAARAEIPDGDGHCFEVEGRRIAVFRVGGKTTLRSPTSVPTRAVR